MKFGLSDLSRILKSSHLEETPNFFSVTVQDNLYMFGASSEAERSSWVKFFRALSVRSNSRLAIFLVLLTDKHTVVTLTEK